MFEREEAEGDGIAFGFGRGMNAAAEVVGKWESRGLGGISKRSGKPAFGFPRSGFSTAGSIRAATMRGLCRPVTSI